MNGGANIEIDGVFTMEINVLIAILLLFCVLFRFLLLLFVFRVQFKRKEKVPSTIAYITGFSTIADVVVASAVAV